MADLSEVQAQLLDVFYEECDEGLAIVETGFLELDVDAPDEEEINRIFRALHSIKGSSGSFGFTAISEFAHHAETLLDEIRAGERSLDSDIVNLFLKSGDHIRSMVSAQREGTEVDSADTVALADAFRRILDSSGASRVVAGEDSDGEDQEEGERDWSIRFEPFGSILQTGNDPIRILRGLAQLGEVEVEADLSALPSLQEIDPEACYVSFALRLRSDASEEDIRENFAWVEDECTLVLGAVEESTEPNTQKASEAPVLENSPESKPTRKASGESAKASTSIRVGTEKVDALINMVGELVIIQSMLSDIGENPDPSKMGKLREGLAQLQNNTRELQESVMRIRMLPISFAFNRFPRLVHDLSDQLNKQVELEITGEGTELDKNVLEQIGDPLVHLVRNALDHGLEPAEERIAAGKSPTGTIRLNACHRGGNIVVEISDDGRGLDAEKIRTKAVERGLIDTDEIMSDERVRQLIFEPGFSTAESVSDVSGRGVGMDVVRRNVKSLGGAIEVISELGKGSTFTVRLPLTLAILDGQLVRVGNEVFVIPLISIIESLQIMDGASNTVAGIADVYRLRDEAVPILRISEIFGLERQVVADAPDGSRLMVVVESGQRKAGLVVDELLGQQQVVIKSLEANYQAVEGFAGATILGDGTVALILDVPGVLAQASKSGLHSSRVQKQRSQSERDALSPGHEIASSREAESQALLGTETSLEGTSQT